MITDDRLTKALKYLAETDEPAAKAKALMEGLGEQRKTVKSIGFLDATGTAGEREAQAYTTAQYIELQGKYENAIYEFEAMRNKRTTESLIVEVWRSEQANRRNTS